MDTGTGLTGDTVLGLLQQRDKSGAAGLGLGELHRGLDLGGAAYKTIKNIS